MPDISTPMEQPLIFWIGFLCVILLLLGIELHFFHQPKPEMKVKKAVQLSAFWIGAALAFNVVVYFYLGLDSALQFFTGYLVEKSLSVDNLFLFLVIFLYFEIPPVHQHRILFWGILGAIVFRIALILAGVALIHHFHWMFYILGVVLLISGIQFLRQKKRTEDLSKTWLYRTLNKILPVAKGDHKGRFFLRLRGKWKVTTLFLALMMIECTDVIMALDSIPAIFAITTDAFIIYTSNLFAVLGLRELYFVVSLSLRKLKYLKFGLAAILIFVGIKMLLANTMPLSIYLCLAVILVILTVTVVASLKQKKKITGY